MSTDSGPTVADGRVFVMDRVDAPKQIELTHAFDEKTGKELWTHEYESEYTVSYVAGPRASVSIGTDRSVPATLAAPASSTMSSADASSR